MKCGITNLGSCLVENLFEFTSEILNAPIKPLLTLINNLMIEPVNIQIFASIWSIIIYMLSLFYGILLVFTGFRFLMSGHSPEQKEKAKRTLSNILIMMVLIQASFLLYSLTIEIVSAISSTIYNQIPSSFFTSSMDSFSNLGLELVLITPYVLILLSTLILLAIRYLCVSAGVIFFAIGIFLYFIEPLQAYGKLIINYLGTLIALPFFYSIILLTASKFLTLPVFANAKILVMIGGFALIDIFTIVLMLFVVIKAANALSGPVGTIIKVAGAI
ncbi:hypothetical protein HNV12_01755 [Methanococcoides sp. SA1]|nr:hypothetical protein [Methanococcoides sp. SA1]